MSPGCSESEEHVYFEPSLPSLGPVLKLNPSSDVKTVLERLSFPEIIEIIKLYISSNFLSSTQS